MEKLGYTVKEAAASIGISKSGIWLELKKGNLEARRAGGRTLITAESLKVWFSNLPKRAA